MSMVVVSVRIPKELKIKARIYGIKISEVLRRALEEEIRRKEIEEIDILLNRFRRGMRGAKRDDIISAVRESRDER